MSHSTFFLVNWTCLYIYSFLGQFYFPYRTYLVSWPSSPVTATSAIASSLSTLATQILDYGDFIWFVNQPLLQTCYMLFKKNGKKRNLAQNSYLISSIHCSYYFLLMLLVCNQKNETSSSHVFKDHRCFL